MYRIQMQSLLKMLFSAGPYFEHPVNTLKSLYFYHIHKGSDISQYEKICETRRHTMTRKTKYPD